MLCVLGTFFFLFGRPVGIHRQLALPNLQMAKSTSVSADLSFLNQPIVIGCLFRWYDIWPIFQQPFKEGVPSFWDFIQLRLNFNYRYVYCANRRRFQSNLHLQSFKGSLRLGSWSSPPSAALSHEKHRDKKYICGIEINVAYDLSIWRLPYFHQRTQQCLKYTLRARPYMSAQ